MPREEFSALVQADPALTRALLACYETDLWRMSHQLKNTAGYLPVERKLAIKLRKLAQEFGRPTPQGTAISFSLTITQMGRLCGRSPGDGLPGLQTAGRTGAGAV